MDEAAPEAASSARPHCTVDDAALESLRIDRRRAGLGTFIYPFVYVCLLRVKPQDLPSSPILLALVLFAHTLMGVIVSAVNLRFDQALAAGVVDTVLLCGLTSALLALHRLRERTVQTLTALAGAGSVIGFLAWPVNLSLHNAHVANDPSPALAALLLAMLGWSLAVSSHILRHALSAPFYVGVLVSVAFYWISLQVLSGLFPIGG